MRKEPKPSPTESPLLFEVDPEPAPEVLTALGGIPLVVQAFRSVGVPEGVKQHVQIKERQRGCDEATFIESFVILNAAGGDCLEDFGRLREDAGLAELIGHELPSPEAAWNFLHAFHEEQKIEDARQRRLPGERAYIPEESAPLAGLGRVNRELVQRLGELFADGSAVRHFAVLNNLWGWKPEKLVAWHREKAGPRHGRNRHLHRPVTCAELPSPAW